MSGHVTFRADAMIRSADFSPCRAYRYTLLRRWAPGRDYAMFIGLNPSTADETQDDPTIRRCMGFARSWGFGALVMTNLFAYRATQPADMKAAADPVGEANDYYLRSLAPRAGVVVAAWGVHGAHMERAKHVRGLIGNLSTLRLTQDGHPGHPLYLPATLRPAPWHVAQKP